MPDIPASPSSACELVADNRGNALLRFRGIASAGMELGANERGAGDAVEVEFVFTVANHAETTLCTVGDANHPARVVARGGGILLECGRSSQVCGRACAGERQSLRLLTGGNRTRIAIDGAPPVESDHAPEATWVYLGEGFPDGRSAAGCFEVDVASVRSRVIATTE